VHGGGPALTAMLDRLGLRSTFVDGHRVTTPAMAEVAEMVLSGTVNKDVVARVVRAGALAVGLSGTDGGLLGVEPHRPGGADIGRVGRITTVQPAPLDALLAAGVVPVVSTTVRDGAGAVWNVNADLVAAALAGALEADRLVFLSDTPGVREGARWLRDVTPEHARALLDNGVAGGGMRPKLEAALDAASAGVGAVDLIDGRVPHALSAALRGQAAGTTLRAKHTAAARRAA
jgi:acetylglutamate kinase